MRQKKVCDIPELLNVFFPFRVLVGECHPVDAPRLTSRPCGTVAVSLTGGSVIRCPRLHIEEKGVPGGMILTDHIGDRRVNMLLRNVPILRIAGLLRRPVEQRQI